VQLLENFNRDFQMPYQYVVSSLEKHTQSRLETLHECKTFH